VSGSLVAAVENVSALRAREGVVPEGAQASGDR
jgi:hypothetical protein